MLVRERIPELLETVHEETLVSAPFVSRMAANLLGLIETRTASRGTPPTPEPVNATVTWEILILMLEWF